MWSKKCHFAAWYSQCRWLKWATKGVAINNVLRRQRGQGPRDTKGFAVRCLHWCRMQVRLPRQRSAVQKRGIHAVGTSLKHLNTIAGHTFSTRKRGGLLHWITEETSKKKKEKALSLPDRIQSERTGSGSFRRLESPRSFFWFLISKDIGRGNY